MAIVLCIGLSVMILLYGRGVSQGLCFTWLVSSVMALFGSAFILEPLIVAVLSMVQASHTGVEALVLNLGILLHTKLVV